MPTKTVTCPKSKPVLLTVYVERPNRRPSSSTHPHHHHPYIHHTIKREVIHYRHGAGGQGYISRRTQLLQYSQRLRLATGSSAAPASKLQTHVKSPQPAAKIVAIRRKPKNSDQAPSCAGNRSFQSFFGLCTPLQAKKEGKTRKKRSATISNKIISAIKNLQGQKKQGVFSKLFPASSKRK